MTSTLRCHACRYRKPISGSHGALSAADVREEPELAGKKRWRKVLYEQQPYPDNYVDDSFLSELKVEGEQTATTCRDDEGFMFV